MKCFDLGNNETRKVSMYYSIIAQHTDNIQSFLSIEMRSYLHNAAQTQLLNHISVYISKGKTRGQLRLLYMNPVALGVWTAMKKAGTIIGHVNQPPRSARLVFGAPFSE
jgi:hypothetical protein